MILEIVEDNQTSTKEQQRDIGETTPALLFKDLQKEFGRCVSKLYVGGDLAPRCVGWQFQNGLTDAWVTLHTAPPTKEDRHYFVLQEGI